MAKRKQTLQQQYIKEIKKLEKRYRKAVSKGFIDTRGRYSDEFGNFIWKVPKRVGSREIKAIKKHSQNFMYENMEFFHPEYQKVVSGRAGLEYIRGQAAKKGWEKRKPPVVSILNEYRAIINTIPDSKYIKGGTKADLTDKKQRLLNTLNQKYTAATDKKAYLDYLESMKDDFSVAVIGVINSSDSDGINNNYSDALAILNVDPVDIQESKEMEEDDELPF